MKNKSRPSPQPLPIIAPQGTDSEMLDNLQRETFDYFLYEVNAVTGLIADKNQPGASSSIAAVGLGITSYIVGIEAGFISRDEATKRVLKILRFFESSVQGPEAEATGYKGFYYHFLDMSSGKRANMSELSTIDTAILMAGILAAVEYFQARSPDEIEIIRIGKLLYERVDWRWALNGKATICHGWSPENGFIPHRWDQGYSEALILYILALGSPTLSIEPRGYREWTETFQWKKIYDIHCIYAGPLFIHQMSQVWVDFRGIRDDLNRKYGLDYFENSRRATYLQQTYAIKNPHGFAHYGEHCWGLTASDGPGPITLELDGIKRFFFDYVARGAPDDLDDGTVSPWAVVASLPFAPEIVLGTIRHAIERLNLKGRRLYGFDASFNPTFPERNMNPNGWVSPWKFGLNQGPVVIMIENYKSELIWKIMSRAKPIRAGLERAGFKA